LDVALTVIAHGCYRWLATRLRGFERAKPKQLYRRFVGTGGGGGVRGHRPGGPFWQGRPHPPPPGAGAPRGAHPRPRPPAPARAAILSKINNRLKKGTTVTALGPVEIGDEGMRRYVESHMGRYFEVSAEVTAKRLKADNLWQ